MIAAIAILSWALCGAYGSVFNHSSEVAGYNRTAVDILIVDILFGLLLGPIWLFVGTHTYALLAGKRSAS